MSQIFVNQVIMKFKKGEMVFKENSFGNEMYIIKAGKIQVSKNINDKKVVLGVLEDNEFFGEMSLFTQKRRTAAAMALEDSKLIVISKIMLDSQLKVIPPWFVTMFKALVERLEKADKRIHV